MAGQGTAAVELLQQLPPGVDAVIVPVGGGGLIGGIAAVMKAWRPEVQVRLLVTSGCGGHLCVS
jgi:threonine dehydratase